jgi:osmotically-inducible protein OsmY
VTAHELEIEEDTEDEMLWSPWAQSDQVTVTVRDGVATLTGVADTWSESQAATDNAFEGGARKVVNKLKVRSGPDYARP